MLLLVIHFTVLHFDKQFLITGASREKEDCSWSVYFADGRNPDRYLFYHARVSFLKRATQ